MVRSGQKKSLTQRDLVSVGRRLAARDAKKPFNQIRGLWHEDTGRRLYNYRRLHALMRKYMPGKKLLGKKVVHLGAGNGVYLHFLAEEYNVHPTSIDTNRAIIAQAKKRGIKANHVRADARKLPLRSNSQDIIVSDHFLFSKFFSYNSARDISATREMLVEAFRVLKPGGFLFIERASPTRSTHPFDPDARERPYLEKSKLEGFEVVEHVQGLHDYSIATIRKHEHMLGLTDIDLHPYMDLVVLQKPLPSEKRHAFVPSDVLPISRYH